jgi:hypothetical protein
VIARVLFSTIQDVYHSLIAACVPIQEVWLLCLTTTDYQLGNSFLVASVPTWVVSRVCLPWFHSAFLLPILPRLLRLYCFSLCRGRIVLTLPAPKARLYADKSRQGFRLLAYNAYIATCLIQAKKQSGHFPRILGTGCNIHLYLRPFSALRLCFESLKRRLDS